MKRSLTVTAIDVQECLGEKLSKRCNLETKKGETIILVRDSRPDLIHIPIKLHEDILNGY